ncbi:alpha-amylase family glycosyl hydrolase [Methylobacterium sp. WSM2598]|uniref:alpha-amylase family glycosyl hydrolase n=1 Tax=Methylobacterium sp. WSM2598 TaxID=398261 RepID=UPI0003762B4C|nr:alpha-amylase family glycosyl hydrolase [Methylobacterium sp. WSM2598]
MDRPTPDPDALAPTAPRSPASLAWWQERVLYQIFVPSFQDADGDGFGDLAGLISRLDHLSDLGIGAVWLTPIYATPFEDAGYDVTDFTQVGARFGDLPTFDRLLAGLHARDIRLILDFVPNHTSDRHPWFRESRASRASPRRDWYVWRDPGPEGSAPNNWLSRFGGSAWTHDARTDQSYYHAFLPSQPDLNWRNPEVRRAMHEVMRFWLRRGVDGFRIDAAAVLAEDAALRDDPPNPDFDGDTPPPERFRRLRTDSQVVTLDYLAELRRVVEEFPDRVLLGEVDTAPDKLPGFYGEGTRRLHLPLNYRLLSVPWKAAALAGAVDAFLDALPPGAWPNWVLGSHDKARIASRVGPAQARVAALMLLTLPGTPMLFAGDEIGMPNVPVPVDRMRDPFERLVPGYGLSRDPSRVPLPWTAGPGGGFSAVEPWLPAPCPPPVAPVAAQARDPASLLSLYRAVIALRRRRPEFRAGGYARLRAEGGVFAYARDLDGVRGIVALNLTPSRLEAEVGTGRILLSTRPGRGGACEGRLCLEPHEGVVIAA